MVLGIIGVGYSKVHSGLHCPMISEKACEIEVPIDKFLLSLLLWCWLLFDEGSMAMVKKNVGFEYCMVKLNHRKNFKLLMCNLNILIFQLNCFCTRTSTTLLS